MADVTCRATFDYEWSDEKRGYKHRTRCTEKGKHLTHSDGVLSWTDLLTAAQASAARQYLASLEAHDRAALMSRLRPGAIGAVIEP